MYPFLGFRLMDHTLEHSSGDLLCLHHIGLTQSLVRSVAAGRDGPRATHHPAAIPPSQVLAGVHSLPSPRDTNPGDTHCFQVWRRAILTTPVQTGRYSN